MWTKKELPDMCPACWNDTSGRVSPCKHPLCADCAKKWFASHSTCPICRAVVTSSPDDALSPPDWSCTVLRMYFATEDEEGGRGGGGTEDEVPALAPPIGITLTSHFDGVLVSRLNRGDLGYRSGLRVGHVITHVNGRRMRDHATAVSILESLRQQRAEVVTVHVRPPLRVLAFRLAASWTRCCRQRAS